jgi:hypothetical protein
MGPATCRVVPTRVTSRYVVLRIVAQRFRTEPGSSVEKSGTRNRQIGRLRLVAGTTLFNLDVEVNPLSDMIVRAFRGVTPPWEIKHPRESGDVWIFARPAKRRIGRQGWKLHISSHEDGAEATLYRALPVLISGRVPFKVLGNKSWLGDINGGGGGLSQIGKFVTVYCADDAELTTIGWRLVEATRGLVGPTIRSDRAVVPGGVIYYRFGAFESRRMQTKLGEICLALTAPNGSVVPDRRRPFYHQPSWVEDPFHKDNERPSNPAATLIAQRYQPVETISHTAHYLVQLALDVDNLRTYVLKRAGVRGSAALRLRREAKLLAKLAGHAGFPTLYELITEPSEIIVAMSMVPGESLEQRVRGAATEGRILEARQIVQLGVSLAKALTTLHEQGFTHGDVKTSNVYVGDDWTSCLIDLDLAQKIGRRDAPPNAGTAWVCFSSASKWRSIV